jgi:integrase
MLARTRTIGTPRRRLFYTGLRLGEVLTLRWEDVDLQDRLLLVRRGLSAGQETLTKGRRHRFVPLSAPAVAALARLAAREEFTGPDDYVLCNRLGRRARSDRSPRPLQARMRRGPPYGPSACTDSGTPPEA